MGDSFWDVSAIFLLSSCAANYSKQCPCSHIEEACLIVLSAPASVDIWWDAPLADFSENPDRPAITLLGDRTHLLAWRDDYLEPGVMTFDEQMVESNRMFYRLGDSFVQ